MNALLVAIQVIAITSAGVLGRPGKGEDTLVLLHVLFRHGNRTPDKSSLFPNDIHLNETYAPYGYSQLTPKGKRTEYEIGRYIRQKYDNLIPDQYTPDVVYAISTNFKRTKMSLELVLSGIFPPTADDNFVDGLDWQPLPFNIEPGQGLLGVASAYCANYVSQYWSYVTSDAAQEICDSYSQLYEALTPLAGFHVKTPRDVAGIYFALKSEEDYGLPLPDWAAQYYPDIIEEAGSVDYEFSTATNALKRLSAGGVVKKIIEDSIAARDGSLSSERKLFLYSAHEWNVATTLRTLNVFFRHIPPFGATIYFEIHNIRNVYGLKLFYQDYKNNEPRQLTIPGCDAFCPLDELYELLADSLPTESDVCAPTVELM